ncbi:hypothetical protein HN499_01610 [archaeon]|jgi:hypothetical protein|nr:hypothetical protein [archaeon]
MATVIDPKVTVLDHGPVLELEDGTKVTPDEIVWGASLITYKDTSVFNELIGLMQEEDVNERMQSGLISSAGAGHASLSTTPGMWVYFEGDSSKFVDSMFSAVRFGSILVPSGRRVPIAEDQILIPRTIQEAGGEALGIYLENSKANINAYMDLHKSRGVPKQVASKAVQYGHRGGGLFFLPLETIVNLALDAESDPDSIPTEGLEILSQLEQQVHERGMGSTYEARKAAPRTGCPNPTIFHHRVNYAQEIVDENLEGVLDSPALLSSNFLNSPEMERRAQEYLRRRKAIFEEGPRTTRAHWRSLLREFDEFVRDYDPNVDVVTGTNSPWRIWGEVKRHRTVPQTAESVYHAAKRASKVVNKEGATISDFHQVLSLPNSVTSNPDNQEIWLDRFSRSVEAYQRLVDLGIPEKDAIAIVPRGLKVGIVKRFGLYNLTAGYGSLRLCNTAEPEMRATTEAEMKLVLGHKETPDYMGTLGEEKEGYPLNMDGLVAPKCGYVGFCPDRTPCAKIKSFDPDYTKQRHTSIKADLADEIREKMP